MKKTVSSFLLLAGILLGTIGSHAQNYDTELKALEARVEKLTSTSLPDFAPELFKSVQKRVRELRAIFDKQGHVPQGLLREAKQELEKFHLQARRTKQSLGKSYGLRNGATRFNFARAFNPSAMYRAEQSYGQAMRLANERKFDGARRHALQAARQYQSLISSAQAQTKSRMNSVLANYQKAVRADIRALNAPGSDLVVLGGMEGVSERIRVERPGFDFNGNGVIEPGYWPPPPPPVGPPPPAGFSITNRTTNSLKISWGDRSDNETGNRVLRSTDLMNWQVVAQAPPIPKLTVFEFTDTNLAPDTRYCYQIETYNNEGALRTLSKCSYTRDGNNLNAWRLQLRVKVANFDGAGTDNALRVSVGNNGEHFPSETYLDYGQDDLERSSDFTYDLNIDHIRELSDITDLSIANYAVGDDIIYIEEIALLFNRREIFSRHFGLTSASALQLGGLYRVEHAELRSHPSWQFYVAQVKAQPLHALPDLVFAPNGKFEFRIPQAEIVSRVESFVGHMLYVDSDIRGKFRWGFIDGPAVEVSRVDDSTIHVDLDMEATFNNWPNPSLDIDFDVGFKTRCDNTARKLTVELASKNFTSNADFTWWKDLVSLGVLKLTDKLIDWYAKNCTTPPEINQSFEVPLPDNFDCSQLGIRVNDEADVSICCFGV